VTIDRANLRFFFKSGTCHLPLGTRHWQNALHENIHAIAHNSARDGDRDFLICANEGANTSISPAGASSPLTAAQPVTASGAGDDETDDRNVEAQ
jgi:hypothetical protein